MCRQKMLAIKKKNTYHCVNLNSLEDKTLIREIQNWSFGSEVGVAGKYIRSVLFEYRTSTLSSRE